MIPTMQERTFLVALSDPDGSYFYFENDVAEVIVIGPMHHNPGQYQRAVSERLGIDFAIVSAEFIPSEDPALNRINLQRGFIRMLFRPEEKAKKVAA